MCLVSEQQGGTSFYLVLKLASWWILRQTTIPLFTWTGWHVWLMNNNGSVSVYSRGINMWVWVYVQTSTPSKSSQKPSLKPYVIFWTRTTVTNLILPQEQKVPVHRCPVPICPRRCPASLRQFLSCPLIGRNHKTPRSLLTINPVSKAKVLTFMSTKTKKIKINKKGASLQRLIRFSLLSATTWCKWFCCGVGVFVGGGGGDWFVAWHQLKPAWCQGNWMFFFPPWWLLPAHKILSLNKRKCMASRGTDDCYMALSFLTDPWTHHKHQCISTKTYHESVMPRKNMHFTWPLCDKGRA